MNEECTHIGAIRSVRPRTPGCEECLRLGDSWVHLRLCRTCGHAGDCDSSTNTHAAKRFVERIIPSSNPSNRAGDWGLCYIDGLVSEAEKLESQERRTNENLNHLRGQIRVCISRQGEGMKVGILGSGEVGRVLAADFLKHGHEAMLGTGRIIQIATTMASTPQPVMADYAAAKAALVNATVSLAKALFRNRNYV